jgi:hypothetical protein
MSTWRWRRCPHCQSVHRASAFAVTEYRPASWQYGTIRRACPSCGWEGPTYRFIVVRERHPAAAGGQR